MNTIKVLPPDVQCIMFSINKPIWNGSAKKREVGLADYRIGDHNEIEFTYTRKDGTRSIPDHYYISGDEARSRKYRRQSMGGFDLIIIPIEDLEILKRGTPRKEGSIEELLEWLDDPRYARTIEELK